jgi:hypothetical protein
MRTDGQINGQNDMTKPLVALRNFKNTPKIHNEAYEKTVKVLRNSIKFTISRTQIMFKSIAENLHAPVAFMKGKKP